MDSAQRTSSAIREIWYLPFEANCDEYQASLDVEHVQIPKFQEFVDLINENTEHGFKIGLVKNGTIHNEINANSLALFFEASRQLLGGEQWENHINMLKVRIIELKAESNGFGKITYLLNDLVSDAFRLFLAGLIDHTDSEINRRRYQASLNYLESSRNGLWKLFRERGGFVSMGIVRSEYTPLWYRAHFLKKELLDETSE